MADFTWSPSQNYLAYWVRESVDIPARLGLLDVASRTDVRSKQLFSVTDCQFYWQKNGEYLAVKVNRYKHAKRGKGPGAPMEYGGLFYNLEIFVLTSKKEVPVESVEIRGMQAFSNSCLWLLQFKAKVAVYLSNSTLFP